MVAVLILCLSMNYEADIFGPDENGQWQPQSRHNFPHLQGRTKDEIRMNFPLIRLMVFLCFSSRICT